MTVVGALSEIIGGVYTSKAYKIFAVILCCLVTEQLSLSYEGAGSCLQESLRKATVEMIMAMVAN